MRQETKDQLLGLAVHHAMSGDQVTELLEIGADPNCLVDWRDRTGESHHVPVLTFAAHKFAEGTDQGALAALLNRGARVSGYSELQQSPLSAIFLYINLMGRRDADSVESLWQLLQEHGCSIKEADDLGMVIIAPMVKLYTSYQMAQTDRMEKVNEFQFGLLKDALGISRLKEIVNTSRQVRTKVRPSYDDGKEGVMIPMTPLSWILAKGSFLDAHRQMLMLELVRAGADLDGIAYEEDTFEETTPREYIARLCDKFSMPHIKADFDEAESLHAAEWASHGMSREAKVSQPGRRI